MTTSGAWPDGRHLDPISIIPAPVHLRSHLHSTPTRHPIPTSLQTPHPTPPGPLGRGKDKKCRAQKEEVGPPGRGFAPPPPPPPGQSVLRAFGGSCGMFWGHVEGVVDCTFNQPPLPLLVHFGSASSFTPATTPSHPPSTSNHTSIPMRSAPPPPHLYSTQFRLQSTHLQSIHLPLSIVPPVHPQPTTNPTSSPSLVHLQFHLQSTPTNHVRHQPYPQPSSSPFSIPCAVCLQSHIQSTSSIY